MAGLPSKRLGLFAAGGALIVRSDSNGEDLESFAGAGAPPEPEPPYQIALKCEAALPDVCVCDNRQTSVDKSLWGPITAARPCGCLWWMPGYLAAAMAHVKPEVVFATGLYDSIPLPPLEEAPVDYANERLLWDAPFQQVHDSVKRTSSFLVWLDYGGDSRRLDLFGGQSAPLSGCDAANIVGAAALDALGVWPSVGKHWLCTLPCESVVFVHHTPRRAGTAARQQHAASNDKLSLRSCLSDL